MDTRNKFFFIKYYIYSRRYFLLQFLLFFGLLLFFSFIFEDSRVVLQYIFTLLLVLGILTLSVDSLIAYKNYHNQLLYGQEQAQTAVEALLFDKIQKMEAEKKSQSVLERERYNDLMDYYTLWAHQIKTPIAAGSLLVQDLTDTDAKKQLGQEFFKIESYVNLVLQYLRLESFHDDLVLKKENLEDLVKEVVKKYALFFIQKGLTLNLHDLDRTIVTDKKWFMIILEQVLSNSLKYTKEGGIEIFCKDDVLYLKDTGLGIKDSDILRVFERGFSGYNGRLTHQSSGLGLYLSKKISDQLGNSLSLESQIGQGTTVKIGLAEKRLAID